jgi:hypothetical protein
MVKTDKETLEKSAKKTELDAPTNLSLFVTLSTTAEFLLRGRRLMDLQNNVMDAGESHACSFLTMFVIQPRT